MKKWMYRGMSMVLALLMLCSLLTFSVWADETETIPEETGFTVDTESMVYAAFEEAAKDLSARQILVYDSTNDQLLYTKAAEGGKLYPASVTKLFTCNNFVSVTNQKLATNGNLMLEFLSIYIFNHNESLTL